MALDTYAGLQAEIAALLMNRTDLTAQIPTWIRLQEAWANRELRVRQMETVNGSFAITANTRTAALPVGFLEARTLVLQTDPRAKLDYVTPADLETLYPGTGSSQPIVYTVVGGNFKFGPTPDANYTAELTYYQKITPLSDIVTSNWLLEDHPDFYLYGAALHSAPWLMDDQRIQTWQYYYQQALEQITQSDERSKYNGAALQVRVEQVV